MTGPRCTRTIFRWIAPALALLLLAGCGSPDGGTVTVAPDSVELRVGETRQLTATLRDAQGSVLTGRTVSWTTSDGAVAGVSSSGLVTAAGAGTAVISATSEGRSGNAAILVTPGANTLPGSASAPAVSAVPLQVAGVREEDYDGNHPELGPLQVSFRVVNLVLEPGATVGAVNGLLGELEAEILGGVPGVAGQIPALLVLRLPTRNHAELAAVLTQLQSSPLVRSVTPDLTLVEDVVPRPSADEGVADWGWGPLTFSANPEGNWGLKWMRVPQLWNLNRWVEENGSLVVTGVFDTGFSEHDDLVYAQIRETEDFAISPGDRQHGTHVAGTIGATFNNGIGVDGVNPFSRLVGRGGTTVALLATDLARWISDAADPGQGAPARVVNISLGYNWHLAGLDTRVDPLPREIAEQEGEFIHAILSSLEARGHPLPVIVATAGNDSETFPDQEARYNSPFTNAAISHGAAPIVVVEAVGMNPTGGVRRAPFSNIDGFVSAPGVQIMSAIPIVGGLSTYGRFDGTSQAAPHVTGLVGYLYALDPSFPSPTMASNPMLEILQESGVALVDAAPSVDAFAAALELDRRRGGDRVLRALLDIDDGTFDGNTRVSLPAGTPVLGDLPEAGDGRVDLRDFRRFRDWLLQVEDGPELALNGDPEHPKRDLNGDGQVQTPFEENFFPRGDFNGDGQISRTARHPVGGVFGGASLTDLEVFQRLFEDPLYGAADLLLDSGDFDVHPLRCLAISGVTEVRTTLRRGLPGGEYEPLPFRVVGLTPAAPRQLFTEAVRPEGYRARVEARAGGEVRGYFEKDVGLAPGSDEHFDPECFRLDLALLFPEEVTPGVPQPLLVTVTRVDPVTGAESPGEGVDLTITVVGGTVPSPFGATNAEGEFDTTVTSTAGAPTLTIIVEASTANGGSSALLTRELVGEVPCSEGVVEGNLSVRGDEQLGRLDGVGTVTSRLSVFGVFTGVVDLRAVCEVGDQLRIGAGFSVPTEMPRGIRLDGLQFVGRTPNQNNPETGTVWLDRVGGLTELRLPKLEHAVARIQFMPIGGGITVENNPDLRRVVIGQEGGELFTFGIGVRANPLLEELAIPSRLRGTSCITGASGCMVRAVTVADNGSLERIRTGRIWVDSFLVQDNPALTEIVLGPDSEIYGLSIRGNQSLRSLAGIPCGTRILGGIFIEGNPQLDVGEAQGLASGCWTVHPDAEVVIQ